MRIITLAILILTASALWADAVPRLETATGELEAIVADLESAQAQSEELRDKLASLESLSAEHQATLQSQDKLLAQYRAAVAELEAHDRASVNLASNLTGQLQAERRLSAWLWPVAGAAVAVALVEGVVLGLNR